MLPEMMARGVTLLISYHAEAGEKIIYIYIQLHVLANVTELIFCHRYILAETKTLKYEPGSCFPDKHPAGPQSAKGKVCFGNKTVWISKSAFNHTFSTTDKIYNPFNCERL